MNLSRMNLSPLDKGAGVSLRFDEGLRVSQYVSRGSVSSLCLQANVLVCEDGRSLLGDLGLLHAAMGQPLRCRDRLGTGDATYRCVIYAFVSAHVLL